MASNELKELDDETHCDCEFFHKYQLPCRDIWAQHQLFGTLKEEDFDRWAFMWEDSGFELYEGITSEYYERGIDGEIGAPARRRLDMSGLSGGGAGQAWGGGRGKESSGGGLYDCGYGNDGSDVNQ